MPSLLIALDLARCFAYRPGFVIARSIRFIFQAERRSFPVKLIAQQVTEEPAPL
jgi:hypothetical protein